MLALSNKFHNLLQVDAINEPFLTVRRWDVIMGMIEVESLLFH
jgi:hypothetical protein